MLPKFIGRDCELSTTGVDGDGRSIGAGEVTRAVLRQIEAAFAARDGVVWSHNGGFHIASMDCLRHWPSNGQCYYADMAHVECCTAACLDPFDAAAQWWHVVHVAEAARRRAQADAGGGDVYSLSTSNVDALDPSISFGTHLSVTLERPLWDDLFHMQRRPSRLAMVASALAAAVAFFGAGYLLPLKDRTVYSLSARAHHISRISSFSTTEAFRRGLLNSRREPHGKGFERLHLICFDFCLLSAPLLCSFLQCLFAAAEDGYCRLQLTDPVRALRIWSWGLDLETGRQPHAAALVDGRRLTLPRYLRELTKTLLRMCEQGVIPESVAPHARELLPQIIELTRHAEAGAIDRCARHLTWASKLLYLLNICGQQGATLGGAVTRMADHDFANTDPQRGLIWSLWEQNLVDPLIEKSAIEACWSDAPAGSRDFARGRIIRRFREHISDVDWSYVELRRSRERWGPRVQIDLPRLDTGSHGQWAELIDTATTVEQLADRLGRAAQSSDPLEDVTGQLLLPAPTDDLRTLFHD